MCICHIQNRNVFNLRHQSSNVFKIHWEVIPSDNLIIKYLHYTRQNYFYYESLIVIYIEKKAGKQNACGVVKMRNLKSKMDTGIVDTYKLPK